MAWSLAPLKAKPATHLYLQSGWNCLSCGPSSWGKGSTPPPQMPGGGADPQVCLILTCFLHFLWLAWPPGLSLYPGDVGTVLGAVARPPGKRPLSWWGRGERPGFGEPHLRAGTAGPQELGNSLGRRVLPETWAPSHPQGSLRGRWALFLPEALRDGVTACLG